MVGLYYYLEGNMTNQYLEMKLKELEDRISKLEQKNDPQLITDHLQECINREIEKRGFYE